MTSTLPNSFEHFEFENFQKNKIIKPHQNFTGSCIKKNYIEINRLHKMSSCSLIQH